MAWVLIAGSIVLLGAIAFGNRIGSRTIFDATVVVSPEPTVLVVAPTAPPTASVVAREWKKSQIVRVAADPGFPDPHVSPAPPPSATPPPPVSKVQPLRTPTEPPVVAATQTPDQTPVWRRQASPEPVTISTPTI